MVEFTNYPRVKQNYTVALISAVMSTDVAPDYTWDLNL